MEECFQEAAGVLWSPGAGLVSAACKPAMLSLSSWADGSSPGDRLERGQEGRTRGDCSLGLLGLQDSPEISTTRYVICSSRVLSYWLLFLFSGTWVVSEESSTVGDSVGLSVWTNTYSQAHKTSFTYKRRETEKHRQRQKNHTFQITFSLKLFC